VLLKIWDKTQTTFLFVSHDLDEALILGDQVIILTKRPAQILEAIQNDLSRPRNHSIMRTQAFFALRQRGIVLFEKAISK
jgi:NitT/TauT family transport system ATP-binding protein